MAVGRGKQSVVAHFDESLWQHVLQEPSDELLRRQPAVPYLITRRLFVLEGDLTILQLQDAVVAHGHPKHVRGKILEGSFARSKWFRVNNPLLLPRSLVDLIFQAGFADQVLAPLLGRSCRVL